MHEISSEEAPVSPQTSCSLILGFLNTCKKDQIIKENESFCYEGVSLSNYAISNLYSFNSNSSTGIRSMRLPSSMKD